ncbi:polyphosphate kinase 1 [Foetidibacter luteolus]|uniref:polyphosphate kinase 1 n=1 Tax=Foetidibacter luteolus TaxID=2608880 RepID=UPI00129B85D2|nr:polyphosphate kinase 1 [Foetidibacter luteolus]
MSKKNLIPRDISWLSFNARVLQEANDPNVPLKQRIRFLGIHSNNMDEFFRVRVATLRRMIELAGKKANMHFEDNPQEILDQIQVIVLQQQNEFNRIWDDILQELKKEKIFLLTEKNLNKEQRVFVKQFFDEEVRSNIIPLLIETLPALPYLRDKSIYLGVVMRKNKSAYDQKYSLIEIPSKTVGRFVQLPSKAGEKNIILLEDVVRFNLPYIFSYFAYDHFDAHIFKVTKDAEIDLDSDVSTTLVQKIEHGLKNRRKGKPVRFIYDKEMDAGLLEYLIRRLNLSRKDNIIPGGRIHNFRHFMDFPDVFDKKNTRVTPFRHPALKNSLRVTDVILEQDVMLHFPYQSFDPVIDLLREAAMDPTVTGIKITAYRLASNSKTINALVNAVRNGKEVVVMLELRARFDEEANLEWKEVLEEEGVKVLLGVPNMKVHAKICVIKKRVGTKTIQYGFVSTGNLNEKTAKVYADHCLLTSNRNIMADINRIFRYLENPKTGMQHLQACKTLMVCPVGMRKQLMQMINKEIRLAKAKKEARIMLKLNSLSDATLINKLQEAAQAGVEVQMIVRGIFCARIQSKKYKKPLTAISIVDEYLEHARVLIFNNGGKERMFISSADWMVRNLDHRVEAAVPVTDEEIKKELEDIIHIQLRDNVKARWLDNDLANNYVSSAGKKKIRSQVETYHYLHRKIQKSVEAVKEEIVTT